MQQGSPNISRRGLLRSLVKGIKPKQPPTIPLVSPKNVIRPPGAIAEDQFKDQCNGCGECVNACSESLIIINNKQAELLFASSYCTRCQACSQACSSGALEQTKFYIAAKPVVTNTCQNTYLFCDSCTDYCQHNALIWRTNQPPLLQDDLCDGCGECVFRCSSAALEMRIY